MNHKLGSINARERIQSIERWLATSRLARRSRYDTSVSGPKIFVMDVPQRLQPDRAALVYPQGSVDWGIEQDAWTFFSRHYANRVYDPGDADFLYLGVFWTRYHLNNDYGSRGISELQGAVDLLGPLSERVFTVCQYDDGPLVDLWAAKVFLGSRKTKEGTDAPLLAHPCPSASNVRGKAYWASFVGRLDTHPIREASLGALMADDRCFVRDGVLTQRDYRAILRKSWIGLAPRGYGGSSFRFLEAVHSGAVPWLIGDIDTRPFKGSINWDKYSFYSATPEEFAADFPLVTMQDVSARRSNLADLQADLRFGQWQRYLLCELGADMAERRI